MKTWSWLTKLVLGLWFLAASAEALAQQSAQPSITPEATATDPAADQTYVLGPQDLIEIELFGAGARGFRVRERIRTDGTIRLPMIMTVAAADKTASELSEQISRDLQTGGFFAAPPNVAITVVSPARSIIVLGAVANPGLIAVDRPYRLSEIVARVGGVRETGADYVILRSEGGEERRISVEELATGDVSQDPYVSSGDKIYIPKAEVFYISGQIKGPGAYPLTSEMTLRMALARGGGLTETGSERRISVIRRNSELDRVDLNTKIEPNDVITVGESFF